MDRECVNFTLTIVFNKQCDKVLMCWHNRQNAYNFVGGHIESDESLYGASYRELWEETGITPEDITLRFVREEKVSASPVLYENDWRMFITFGVLERSVVLTEEDNRLCWMDIDDERIGSKSMGFGNCRVFLNEALGIINNSKDRSV